MLTITIPDDLAERITAEATQLGITPEELMLTRLNMTFPVRRPLPNPHAKNLLEFLGPMVGSVRGKGESLSEDTGRHFTDGLVEAHARQIREAEARATAR